MPKDEAPSKKLFTLPLDYAHEVLQECDEQIILSNELLKAFYDDGINKPHNTYAAPYVVEVLWLNYCIRELLSREVNDPVYYEEESIKEKEYILMEETIYQLQALMISRYNSNLNLTRISYSVSLH